MAEGTEAAAVPQDELLRMTRDIVVSFVRGNHVDAEALPELISAVHSAMAGLQRAGAPEPAQRQKPAVPINKSVTDEYIICLEDGRKLRMLKRYLRARYDMSPEDYRKKWNLPLDYPMVAPNYAARRSEFAKSIGLGRKNKRKR
jgi:predicted transcriptional regulator